MHRTSTTGKAHAVLLAPVLLMIFALCGLPGRAAEAAIVTYEFTGTGSIFGEVLTGTFSYDTATPGVVGHYALSGVLNFSIGADTGLTGPLGEIVIVNGESALSDPDYLSIGSLAPAVTSPFFEGAALFMEFFDPSGTAFTTDLLSDPLPPLSAFGSATFVAREFIASIEFNHVNGTINSLRLVTDTSVPEPGTLLLLGGAGIALALATRRRIGLAMNPSTRFTTASQERFRVRAG